MNIIIPIGGIGKRFMDDGYTFPKPLIRVNGLPMIFYVLDSLNIKENDVIFIPYRTELDNYNFKDIIIRRFPKYNFCFIDFNIDTRGASETVLIALNKMSDTQLKECTIIIDSDNFFEEDILTKAREFDDNVIFYFLNDDINPIYSYVNIDNNEVIEIKEKEKISNYACAGAYCFKSAIILKNNIEYILKNKIKQKNEFYVSNIYQVLIENKHTIYASEIKNFNCLGTPQQLKSFCTNLTQSTEKLRICFDLDNTLVSYPTTPNDYTTVKPIKKNINKLKYYKSLGHHIIIYTARRMKTHHGNIGAIVADVGKITLETLDKFEIPYDEIYFGKPYANFYIDDLAINAFSDIDKEIGLYNVHPQPRHTNNIEVFKNKIIKKSNNISGELYYYNNIPQENTLFFPKLIDSNIKDGIIILEKINGITFSFLYTNNILTEKDLNLLLNTIYNIHESSCDEKFDINIYSNYSNKMLNRQTDIFQILSTEKQSFYKSVSDQLKYYEYKKAGKMGIIHGDTVFTNILYDINNNIKFIDMRGLLGDVLTIRGDVFYDYAKIYQSLIGYDNILLDVDVNENYMKNMINYFEKFIVSKFDLETLKNIKIITSSLLLSLIHIHQGEKHESYYKLACDNLKNNKI